MSFETVFSLWNVFAFDSVVVLSVEVIIKACLILGVISVLAQTRLSISAATRHRLWCCAFVGLLILPLMAFGLAGWDLPVLPNLLATKAAHEESSTSQKVTHNSAATVDRNIDNFTGFSAEMADSATEPIVLAKSEALVTAESASAELEATVASQTALSSQSGGSWSSTLFIVWLIGVVVALAPLPFSALRAAWLLRSSRRIWDDDWLRMLSEIKDRFGLESDIRLFEIDQRVIPMTWGFRRSIVLLPASSIGWSKRRKSIVLAHELAHIARRDLRWQVLARFACAVHWFNPLAWYALRQLRSEQELACDDCVVHAGTRATDYATELVGIAESHQVRRAALAVAMAHSSDLEHRLKSLFDSARSHLPLGNWRTRMLLAVGVATSAVVSLLHPVAVTAEDVAKSESGEATALSAGTTGSKIDKDASESEFVGRVVDKNGKPVASAEIWCAAPPRDYHDKTAPGNVHRLTSSDRQGNFSFRLKQLEGAGLDASNWTYRCQLTAKAVGYGFDWLPLAVFEKNGEASSDRRQLQQNVDKLFGAGRFASQTLELPKEAGPVRGRLVDLEGRPLAGVRVRVESIQDPEIPALLEAFEKSSSDMYYRAINNRSAIGVWISRREWRAMMPAVKTNGNGEFILRGLGRDQMATVTLSAERVAAQQFYILGREMETQRLPHIFAYPNGAKDVYVGTRFTHAVGPAVPIHGVVTEFQSGKPIANATVFVERLFRREGRNTLVQLNLNTRHIRAVTDEQGRYQLTGVPPGEKHVLNVTPPKSEPWLMAQQEISIDPNQSDATINLKVFRGIWVEGQVTDASTGDPVKGQVDYLALQKNPNIPQKFGLEDDWEMGRFPFDESGRYRVVGLPGPGVLLVRARGGKTYPLSVGVEDVDGYDGNQYLPTTPTGLPLVNWNRILQIDPPKDAEVFAVDVTLSAGESLKGRIVRPVGASESMVKALGLVDKNSFFESLKDDTFTVHDYKPQVPRNLFFRTDDQSWVGHLHLEGSPSGDLTVRLQPSVTVRGRLVETATGDAAIGYHVHCRSSKRGEFRADDVLATDGDGRFEIQGLLAGNVYKMDASNVQRFVSRKNGFTIDLTDAKPGDVIELGDVTGKHAKSAKMRTNK